MTSCIVVTARWVQFELHFLHMISSHMTDGYSILWLIIPGGADALLQAEMIQCRITEQFLIGGFDTHRKFTVLCP